MRRRDAKLFDGLMTAKIVIEDLIELERLGRPSGFKVGSLRSQLSALNDAVEAPNEEDCTHAS